MKKRLDILLVERGLAPSREKAKALIMSGIVYVDGEKEDKAGMSFDEKRRIEVRGKTLPYVSRHHTHKRRGRLTDGLHLQETPCGTPGIRGPVL